MLRSRFRRSSLGSLLAASPAPGGTMGVVRGRTQFRKCWPRRDSTLTWLCAALIRHWLFHHPLCKPAIGERSIGGGCSEVEGSRRETIKTCTLSEWSALLRSAGGGMDLWGWAWLGCKLDEVGSRPQPHSLFPLALFSSQDASVHTLGKGWRWGQGRLQWGSSGL